MTVLRALNFLNFLACIATAVVIASSNETPPWWMWGWLFLTVAGQRALR